MCMVIYDYFYGQQEEKGFFKNALDQEQPN